MDKLICVATFANRTQAEIARGILESNGIPSSISADDAGGMLPLPSGAKLWVIDDKSAAAGKLLKHLEAEFTGHESEQ